ncbi:MAG: sugar phosphate isomerase/epimerase [Abitibacteriaceae bacterium]|nr:sugar phosphate isomerase/epimerase [Abditibacteriaceae bacterium]MBV9866589.1 sugar phosphate isomerase/epimerase [Abditibacteriaceae bacterium]
MSQEKIRIGTIVNAGGKNNPAHYIRQILPHGFESFQIMFWQTLGGANLEELAQQVNEALVGSDAVISSLGIFGNPLGSRDIDQQTREGWEKCIEAAHLFNCNMVVGFAGRVVDKPIPESMGRYAEVFGALGKRAANKGVRIAFENCDMGGDWQRGDWNIAHNPTAWEMMFNAIPSENIGLEWEPCHQMVSLIDPMPQLRKWLPKIFHVHGKDATVLWDVVREYGVHGPKEFAFHRTPGFGDSNWTDIISELRRGGYEGSIDIEGWHDPVYRDELEMTGQVHALNYLKRCRGGSFVPNPQ